MQQTKGIFIVYSIQYYKRKPLKLETKAIAQSEVQTYITQYFLPLLDTSKCIAFLQSHSFPLTQNPNWEELVQCLANHIYQAFLLDAEFVAQKDPSLTSVTEVLASRTNSLLATLFFRIANFFYYTPLTTHTAQTKTVCRQFMQQCLLETILCLQIQRFDVV